MAYFGFFRFCVIGSLARGFLGLLLVVTSTGALALGSGPAAAADYCGNRNLRLMTQNMYVGSDFAALLAAQTLPQFLQAVTLTYQNILASRPDERAAAVAREIARYGPDVVGLQEADIVRTGSQPPATHVETDQLKALLAALDRLGEHYEAVAVLPEVDVEAPSTLGFDVRLTERTVIIARTGSRDYGVDLSNTQVQTYAVNRVFTTPAGSITNTRGWASVDVAVCGRKSRFVTTHLEATPPFATQRAQAQELVESAANTTLPVVLAGDFNTTANDPQDPTFPTYQFLLNAGFVDAWRQKRPGDPGFTCCQAPNLLNPVSTLTQRIDLVLYRGAFRVDKIRLVGDQQGDRTPSGLRPSDHAGIVASLRVSRR